MTARAAKTLAILVAAVDYAALDDITTGRDPSLWMEWAFLFASVPLLVMLWRAGRTAPDARPRP